MAQLSDAKNKDMCAGCSLCCESISIEIDAPEDFEDLSNIVWYILHKDVLVYIDHDNDWYVSFKTRCDPLSKEGLCGIYDDRPKVCRDYTQEGCEKYGDGPFWKHLFTKPDLFLEYLEKKRPKLWKIYQQGEKRMRAKSARANAKAQGNA